MIEAIGFYTSGRVVKMYVRHGQEKKTKRSFLFVHAIPLNTLLNKLQRENVQSINETTCLHARRAHSRIIGY